MLADWVKSMLFHGCILKFSYPPLNLVSFNTVTGIHAQREAPKNPAYTEDCMVWDNATRYIEHQPNVDVTCTKNGPCTGLDCTGVYSYRVI